MTSRREVRSLRRRPLLSLAVALLLVSESHAQAPSTTTAEPGKTVVVVLDLSYSMSLTTGRGSERRIDLAIRAVRELARRTVAGERWYLLPMSAVGGTERRPGLTPLDQVVWRSVPAPAGTTPLARSLADAADALDRLAPGGGRRVLLVTDGIATEGTPFQVPNGEWFAARGIQVTGLLFGLQELQGPQLDVRRFLEATGGSALDLRAVTDAGGWAGVLQSLRRPDPASSRSQVRWTLAPGPGRGAVASGGSSGAAVSARAGDPPAAAVAVVAEPLPVIRAQEPSGFRPWVAGRTATFRLIWLAIPLLPFTVLGLTRRVRGILVSLGTPRAGVVVEEVVRLDVRSPGGATGGMAVRGLPVTLGASAAARVRLPPSGASTGVPDFELRSEREGLVLVSSVPLNVNGVARRRKTLRPGDTIVYHGHRITFRAVTQDRTVVKRPPAGGGLPWELALLAMPVLAGILYREPVSIVLPRRAPRVEAAAPAPVAWRLAVHAGGSSGSARTEGGPVRATGGAGASTKSVSLARATVVSTVSVRPREVAYLPPRGEPEPASAVRVLAPGDALDDVVVDALFLHAHPDDESIDFAALLTALARAGRSTAVVLFTDGESGLDQYPDRAVTGAYADRELTSPELGAVRPEEARRALSRLGATVYIRLGLRNHPYTSVAQVLSQRELMGSWGGEEALVERVVRVIETLRPRLVVSPDSAHGGAHEHFEHAGVGYVVREALRRIRERGNHTVEAHLRSVDPRFTTSYGTLEVIDALSRPAGGPSLRSAQISALGEHVTQRDATQIAVESLSSRRWEYYDSDYWGDMGPLERFLASW